MFPIITVAIAYEQDVVLARQRTRQLAESLGFDSQQQTRLATAVSEIARNAYQYAGGGRVQFDLESETAPQVLVIRVSDSGPGIRNLKEILENRYTSPTGMGAGIVGARRLMDRFEIQSEYGRGTSVWMRKLLPRHVRTMRAADLEQLAAKLDSHPQDLLEELRRQNTELLGTLEELRDRQEQLARLNRELEDTNRGVVALYAELDERADHLRRADEIKTRFLSNMTHEFRTPLNSILALSRLLLDRLDGDLTAEQEKQVHYIRKAAESLSDLVNDLLDLAKVAAGKIVIRAAEFEVKDLFGALRGMLRPLLLDTSVNLIFEDPENLPPLSTDEAKVSQILRNFISNALKFTERGEVRVSARLTPEGDDVIFSVSDTGIGIAEEDTAAIFEEFSQIESPLQRNNKGTGLGLPLSRKLAELLGGEVAVESTLGVGSTFSARIPAVYGGAKAEQVVVAMPQAEAERSTVLLIDDEVESRLLYEKYLRGSHFQVIAARSVREGEAVLGRTKPAAIVLSCLTRDGDAWALLVGLKARTETSAVPVLVYSKMEDRAKALSLGADAFSTKPMERRWLLRKLIALTGGETACKVLIVDDDEVSRYVMRQLFPADGTEVMEAANGMEALRYARDEQPDFIVLDLLMPEMSGFQVLDRLQADSRTSHIPVIVSTSRLLDETDRARLRHTPARLLPKSAISDGTAARELRRIFEELGMEEKWGAGKSSSPEARAQ